MFARFLLHLGRNHWLLTVGYFAVLLPFFVGCAWGGLEPYRDWMGMRRPEGAFLEAFILWSMWLTPVMLVLRRNAARYIATYGDTL